MTTAMKKLPKNNKNSCISSVSSYCDLHVVGTFYPEQFDNELIH